MLLLKYIQSLTEYCYFDLTYFHMLCAFYKIPVSQLNEVQGLWRAKANTQTELRSNNVSQFQNLITSITKYRVIILYGNYRFSDKIMTLYPLCDIYQPLKQQLWDILHLAQLSIIAKNPAVWCSGNILGLQLEVTRFKSWRWHWWAWLFRGFTQLVKDNPGIQPPLGHDGKV